MEIVNQPICLFLDVIGCGSRMGQSSIRPKACPGPRPRTEDKQGLPHNGIAGGYVYAHPEPRRTDSTLLRILQQRLTRKTAEGRQR